MFLGSVRRILIRFRQYFIQPLLNFSPWLKLKLLEVTDKHNKNKVFDTEYSFCKLKSRSIHVYKKISRKSDTLSQAIYFSEEASNRFSLKILTIGGELQCLLKALKVHIKGSVLA